MGFSDTWIKWMMLCVSSVNYSALVNFEKVGPIHPGRGLRQGDPLSPYLFILVTEGLTSLIHKAVASGDIHGIKVCRGAPIVSHLLFADDCFLFCRANIAETTKLMEILKIYELASGQEINLSKSEVFFSRNLSRAGQEDLSNIMGVRHVLGTGTYLGLPSMVGRSKKETFAYIKDRIWKRINGWRSRPLSRAGKEVMIKSVLQAIPAYVMNIFLLPDTLVNDIERMINAFWWGGGSNNRGIKWLAWDKLACPKEEGGLGFRDFQSFNMAMVAKQGWNLMSNPSSLVARVYKARYFPQTSLLDSNLGNNPSFAWRSIWRARQVLINGCRWQIGDGKNIKIMHEPWLRDKQERCVSGPQHQDVYDLLVHHLLLPNNKRWDVAKINSLFSSTVARDILAVPLLEYVQEDKLIWGEENNGVYSVRSGYKKIMKDRCLGYGPRVREGWGSIWKLQTPPKAKHLIWRICKECLPTRTRLRNRLVQCPVECPLCLNHDEDDWHLFFTCEGVKEAWSVMELSHVIDSRLHNFNNIRDLLFDVCRREAGVIASRAAVLIWFIWQVRNNKVWNDDSSSAIQTGMQAMVYWSQWAEVNGVLQEQHQLEQQLPSVSSQSQWQRPASGMMKCNVDASFFNTNGATGWGWCLRDSRGQFKLAGTNIVSSPHSVMEGEALALIEAMEVMIHRGLTHVIFESDSKLVVDAISSSHNGISEFSILISYIQALLGMNNYFEVKYIKRQANMVAHTLARAAYSLSRRTIFDSIPRCIVTLLNNESY
ncbi:hypothetical protein P8452_17266 [Trifolium repens]|nr:hypothetical protein P8452_17266 [Trifolium repens]